MRKTFKAIMAAMAVAVLSWPTVCFGQYEEREIVFTPIDKQEYLAEKKDSCAYNIYPKRLSSDSIILNEFISKVIEMDDDARRIYSESKKGPDESDECDYNLFDITSGDTTIYMLRFTVGVLDFSYFASKSTDGMLCVSDVRIDSAPIVISKNGYIAGFEENVDAFYARMTLCAYTLDKTTRNISITKLGTFVNDTPWKVNWACENPVFWSVDTLYIEGMKYPGDDADWGHLKQDDIISYYKLDISGLK